MKYFCTYFDANYSTRALAMYRSLYRHCQGKCTLYVLCLDDDVARLLERAGLAGIVPVLLSDLEESDPALAAVKQGRSRTEYYFTITPALIVFLFKRFTNINLLTYLDADLFFYGPLEPIFNELGDRSILIIPHRFSSRTGSLAKYGDFNVAFNTFRNDDPGRACANWWRNRCIDWCYDRVEDERFADQKYLNAWPRMFGDSLQILTHKGANVSPWNLDADPVSLQRGTVTIGRDALIFYHFEGYRSLRPRFHDTNIRSPGYSIPPELVRAIHFPYVRELVRTRRIVRRLSPASVIGAGNGRLVSQQGVSLVHAVGALLLGECILTLCGRCWYVDVPLLRALHTMRQSLRVDRTEPAQGNAHDANK